MYIKEISSGAVSTDVESDSPEAVVLLGFPSGDTAQGMGGSRADQSGLTNLSGGSSATLIDRRAFGPISAKCSSPQSWSV